MVDVGMFVDPAGNLAGQWKSFKIVCLPSEKGKDRRMWQVFDRMDNFMGKILWDGTRYVLLCKECATWDANCLESLALFLNELKEQKTDSTKG